MFGHVERFPKGKGTNIILRGKKNIDTEKDDKKRISAAKEQIVNQFLHLKNVAFL